MTIGKGKRSGQKRDFMQVARDIVEHAIGEQMDGKPLEKPVDTRNPHFVALGSAGAQHSSSIAGLSAWGRNTLFT